MSLLGTIIGHAAAEGVQYLAEQSAQKTAKKAKPGKKTPPGAPTEAKAPEKEEAIGVLATAKFVANKIFETGKEIYETQQKHYKQSQVADAHKKTQLWQELDRKEKSIAQEREEKGFIETAERHLRDPENTSTHRGKIEALWSQYLVLGDKGDLKELAKFASPAYNNTLSAGARLTEPERCSLLMKVSAAQRKALKRQDELYAGVEDTLGVFSNLVPRFGTEDLQNSATATQYHLEEAAAADINEYFRLDAYAELELSDQALGTETHQGWTTAQIDKLEAQTTDETPDEIVLNRQTIFARTSVTIGKRDRAREHMKKAEAPLNDESTGTKRAMGRTKLLETYHEMEMPEEAAARVEDWATQAALEPATPALANEFVVLSAIGMSYQNQRVAVRSFQVAKDTTSKLPNDSLAESLTRLTVSDSVLQLGDAIRAFEFTDSKTDLEKVVADGMEDLSLDVGATLDEQEDLPEMVRMKGYLSLAKTATTAKDALANWERVLELDVTALDPKLQSVVTAQRANVLLVLKERFSHQAVGTDNIESRLDDYACSWHNAVVSLFERDISNLSLEEQAAIQKLRLQQATQLAGFVNHLDGDYRLLGATKEESDGYLLDKDESVVPGQLVRRALSKVPEEGGARLQATVATADALKQSEYFTLSRTLLDEIDMRELKGDKDLIILAQSYDDLRRETETKRAGLSKEHPTYQSYQANINDITQRRLQLFRSLEIRSSLSGHLQLGHDEQLVTRNANLCRFAAAMQKMEQGRREEAIEELAQLRSDIDPESDTLVAALIAAEAPGIEAGAGARIHRTAETLLAFIGSQKETYLAEHESREKWAKTGDVIVDAFTDPIAAEHNDLHNLWLKKDYKLKKRYAILETLVDDVTRFVRKVNPKHLPANFEEALDLYREAHPEKESELAQLDAFIAKNKLQDLVQRVDSIIDNDAQVRKAKADLELVLAHDTSWADGDGSLAGGIYAATDTLSGEATSMRMRRSLGAFRVGIQYEEMGGHISRDVFSAESAAIMVATMGIGWAASTAGRATATAIRVARIERRLAKVMKLNKIAKNAKAAKYLESIGMKGKSAAQMARSLEAAQLEELAWLTRSHELAAAAEAMEAAQFAQSGLSIAGISRAATYVPGAIGYIPEAAVFHAGMGAVMPGPHGSFAASAIDLLPLKLIGPLAGWQGIGGAIGRSLATAPLMTATSIVRVKADQALGGIGLAAEGEDPTETQQFITGLLTDAVYSLGDGLQDSTHAWHAQRSAAKAHADASSNATPKSQPNKKPPAVSTSEPIGHVGLEKILDHGEDTKTAPGVEPAETPKIEVDVGADGKTNPGYDPNDVGHPKYESKPAPAAEVDALASTQSPLAERIDMSQGKLNKLYFGLRFKAHGDTDYFLTKRSEVKSDEDGSYLLDIAEMIPEKFQALVVKEDSKWTPEQAAQFHAEVRRTVEHVRQLKKWAELDSSIQKLPAAEQEKPLAELRGQLLDALRDQKLDAIENAHVKKMTQMALDGDAEIPHFVLMEAYSATHIQSSQFYKATQGYTKTIESARKEFGRVAHALNGLHVRSHQRHNSPTAWVETKTRIPDLGELLSTMNPQDPQRSFDVGRDQVLSFELHAKGSEAQKTDAMVLLVDSLRGADDKIELDPGEPRSFAIKDKAGEVRYVIAENESGATLLVMNTTGGPSHTVKIRMIGFDRTSRHYDSSIFGERIHFVDLDADLRRMEREGRKTKTIIETLKAYGQHTDARRLRKGKEVDLSTLPREIQLSIIRNLLREEGVHVNEADFIELFGKEKWEVIQAERQLKDLRRWEEENGLKEKDIDSEQRINLFQFLRREGWMMSELADHFGDRFTNVQLASLRRNERYMELAKATREFFSNPNEDPLMIVSQCELAEYLIQEKNWTPEEIKEHFSAEVYETLFNDKAKKAKKHDHGDDVPPPPPPSRPIDGNPFPDKPATVAPAALVPAGGAARGILDGVGRLFGWVRESFQPQEYAVTPSGERLPIPDSRAKTDHVAMMAADGGTALARRDQSSLARRDHRTSEPLRPALVRVQAANGKKYDLKRSRMEDETMISNVDINYLVDARIVPPSEERYRASADDIELRFAMYDNFAEAVAYHSEGRRSSRETTVTITAHEAERLGIRFNADGSLDRQSLKDARLSLKSIDDGRRKPPSDRPKGPRGPAPAAKKPAKGNAFIHGVKQFLGLFSFRNAADTGNTDKPGNFFDNVSDVIRVGGAEVFGWVRDAWRPQEYALTPNGDSMPVPDRKHDHVALMAGRARSGSKGKPDPSQRLKEAASNSFSFDDTKDVRFMHDRSTNQRLKERVAQYADYLQVSIETALGLEHGHFGDEIRFGLCPEGCLAVFEYETTGGGNFRRKRGAYLEEELIDEYAGDKRLYDMYPILIAHEFGHDYEHLNDTSRRTKAVSDLQGTSYSDDMHHYQLEELQIDARAVHTLEAFEYDLIDSAVVNHNMKNLLSTVALCEIELERFRKYHDSGRIEEMMGRDWEKRIFLQFARSLSRVEGTRARYQDTDGKLNERIERYREEVHAFVSSLPGFSDSQFNAVHERYAAFFKVELGSKDQSRGPGDDDPPAPPRGGGRADTDKTGSVDKPTNIFDDVANGILDGSSKMIQAAKTHLFDPFVHGIDRLNGALGLPPLAWTTTGHWAPVPDRKYDHVALMAGRARSGGKGKPDPKKRLKEHLDKHDLVYERAGERLTIMTDGRPPKLLQSALNRELLAESGIAVIELEIGGAPLTHDEIGYLKKLAAKEGIDVAIDGEFPVVIRADKGRSELIAGDVVSAVHYRDAGVIFEAQILPLASQYATLVANNIPVRLTNIDASLRNKVTSYLLQSLRKPGHQVEVTDRDGNRLFKIELINNSFKLSGKPDLIAAAVRLHANRYDAQDRVLAAGQLLGSIKPTRDIDRAIGGVMRVYAADDINRAIQSHEGIEGLQAETLTELLRQGNDYSRVFAHSVENARKTRTDLEQLHKELQTYMTAFRGSDGWQQAVQNMCTWLRQDPANVAILQETLSHLESDPMLDDSYGHNSFYLARLFNDPETAGDSDVIRSRLQELNASYTQPAQGVRLAGAVFNVFLDKHAGSVAEMKTLDALTTQAGALTSQYDDIHIRVLPTSKRLAGMTPDYIVTQVKTDYRQQTIVEVKSNRDQPEEIPAQIEKGISQITAKLDLNDVGVLDLYVNSALSGSYRESLIKWLAADSKRNRVLIRIHSNGYVDEIYGSKRPAIDLYPEPDPAWAAQ